MNINKAVIVSFALLACTSQTASACDYCSIYTPLSAKDLKAESVSVGVSVNLLGYSHTRLDGESYQPGANQNHKTTVAEVEAGYDLSDRIGFQVDLPFVFQQSKRLLDGVFDSSSDSGLGDVAMYGRFTAADVRGADSHFIGQIAAGVKLPTGDAGALSEIADEHHANSGIYGSDLTLGTGSTDVPLALLVKGSIGRFTAGGTAEYTIRSEGDASYRFADDLRWDGWIGHQFALEGDAVFEPRIHLNGISKDHDQRNGMDLVDTGLTLVSVGPEVVFTFAKNIDVSIEADAPIVTDNDGLQSITDHRVLIGVKGKL